MAQKIRSHPLKGKFREVAQVTVSGNGITDPIEIVQNGKHRVLRLSKQHRKLDQNIILALLGPEWMNELSSKGIRVLRGRTARSLKTQDRLETALHCAQGRAT